MEEINRTVRDRAFWEDRAFMSSTLLHRTFALRLCIINRHTIWDGVREILEATERFGTEAVRKGKKTGYWWASNQLTNARTKHVAADSVELKTSEYLHAHHVHNKPIGKSL